MKEKLKMFSGVLMILSALLFAGCANDKEDDEKSDHSDAWVDAFIQKFNPGSGIVYGLNVYAGGENLTTATVTSPAGTEYSLEEFWQGAGNLRRHATGSDTTTVDSYAGFDFGEYTFTLGFSDGETLTLTDTISESDGEIAQNAVAGSLNVTHTSGADTLVISYSEPTGPQRYIIKLTDEDMNDSKPYYACQYTEYHADFATGYTIDKGESDISVSNPNASCSPDSGWKRDDLTTGASYYSYVVGVRFEDSVVSASSFDYSEAHHNRHMVFPAKFESAVATW